METFDQKGGLNDKLGRHKATEIPAGLSWEQMGPKIRAELKPQKRRWLVWWWLPIGLSVILGVAYLNSLMGTPDLSFFPIPGLPAGQNTTAVVKVQVRSGDQIKEEERGNATGAFDQNAKQSSVVEPSVTAKQSALESPSQGKVAIAIKDIPSVITEGNAWVFSDTVVQNQEALGLLDEIVSMVPGQVESQDTSGEDRITLDLLSSNSSAWIIEAAAGVTYSLSPDSYSARLPNTVIDPLNGVTTRFRVGYRLKQGACTIWSGVEMEELVQRERLQEVLPIQVFQPNTVDTIFRNTITGEVFTTTTDSVPGIRSVNIQQHSTFRSWAVPVLIGKSWSAGGWQLEGKAGLDFNLSSWSSGGYLTDGYQLTEVRTEYRTGWAMRLEGQLLLPPVRLGRLFVSGGYRRFLNQPEGLIERSEFRPESLNLTVGWRLPLNP